MVWLEKQFQKLFRWPHLIGVGAGLLVGALASLVQDLIADPLASFAFALYMGFGAIAGYLVSEAFQRPFRKPEDKIPFTDWHLQALGTFVSIWGCSHFAGWKQALAYFGNWLIVLLILALAAFIIAPYLWRNGGRLEVFKRPKSRTLAVLIFAGGVVCLWFYLGKPLQSLLEDIVGNRGPWWFWLLLALFFGAWWSHRYFRVRRQDKKKS